MFERRSPLTACVASGGRDGTTGGRSVQIVAVYGWQLVLLSAFRGREAEVAHWLADRVGIDLPPVPLRPTPGVTIRGIRGTALNTAPGQYWVVTTDDSVPRELQSSMPSHAGTVTTLSDGYVRLAICGMGWRDLLSKGISVDLHPDVLRIGDFVLTSLHHIGILLQRTGESRVELYVPRTFALCVWEWLTDAALPLGYDLRQEEAGRQSNC